MPDWRTRVREHLEACGLPPGKHEDVICELAVHLEETYEDARGRGLNDAAAVEITLAEVEDWKVLRERISCAKSGEDPMNHRTKTLWLPGIAILFAAGLLLMLLDRAETVQRLIWIGCIGMLWCAAISEANHMNQRTRCLWLPGFLSMTAAALFLLAVDTMNDPFSFFAHDPSYFFTKISLQPQYLVRLDSGPGRTFYSSWLLGQILFGGLGAYLSRRAGGTRMARIVAGAFPVLVMFGLCGLVVPISAIFFEHNAFALAHPATLAVGMLVWAVVPGIPVLVGIAPFLRELEPDQVRVR